MDGSTPSRLPRLLTMKEVAEALRIPEATLRHWRRTGQGPKSAKLGGRVMYREDDVLAWINEAFEEDQQ